MTQRREFSGEFWLAGQEGARQRGYLRVAPGSAPVVSTEGALRSRWREISRTQGADGRTLTIAYDVEEQLTAPMAVQGVDDHGNPLTLLEAQTSRLGPPDSAGMTYYQRGIRAIVGGHVDSSAHEFAGLRVRLEHLDAWRPWLRAHDTGRPSTVALASGGTITFEEDADTNSLLPTGLWIVVQGITPCTLRGLDRQFLRPLVTLFTLATDTSCQPLAVQVKDSPDKPWWDVYSAALVPDYDQAHALPDQANWLLRPADVDMQHVGTWLDSVDVLGPLPPVVADLVQASAISLENQVMQLTTIAEGLHRRLQPDDVRFNEPMAEQIREAAVSAVTSLHDDAAAVVRGLLSHVGDVSYGKRLAWLANAVQDAVPGVTGKVSKWKALVTEARDEFAHRLPRGHLTDVDVDRFLTVAVSLRWLLVGLLLLEADVPPSLLAARFADHEPYRRFLADARAWYPKAYG